MTLGHTCSALLIAWQAKICDQVGSDGGKTHAAVTRERGTMRAPTYVSDCYLYYVSIIDSSVLRHS